MLVPVVVILKVSPLAMVECHAGKLSWLNVTGGAYPNRSENPVAYIKSISIPKLL